MLFEKFIFQTLHPPKYISVSSLISLRARNSTKRLISVIIPMAKSAVSQSLSGANTERESMKQLLHSLERENKGLRYRIFGALQRGNIDGFKAVGMTGLKDYEESES